NPRGVKWSLSGFPGRAPAGRRQTGLKACVGPEVWLYPRRSRPPSTLSRPPGRAEGAADRAFVIGGQARPGPSLSTAQPNVRHRSFPLGFALARRSSGGCRRSLRLAASSNGTPLKPPAHHSGDYMATAAAASTAPTREDFAAMLDEAFGHGNLQEGTVVKGKVVGIEKDLALIDVGAKTEGRVAIREFSGPGRGGEIKVGDEVEVYLERIENALGEAVLSRDKARREESWGKLEKAFQAGEKVTGVIFNQVKGGFTVDLDGAVAFLPRSQVDIRPIRDVTPLMNVNQPFQILKMDRRRGNIVVSRRTVLEETRAEQRQELVQNLEEGQVIDGVVKNITDYGAFVDLGGIDGLLHVTDIAWRRVNHPSEVLNIGQTVKVKIVKINHDTHRISLGMKQLQDDPWQGIEAKYPVGARLHGRVTNITDYGAFVELEPGIEGLIHVSEMSWTKKNVHPGKIVSTSQEVDVQILEVDPVKRRISLGLKQTMRNPWE